MTNEQLKKLEDDLWASANSLRAYGGLKAADYAVPVLGLIFLRFADNKYSHYETEINAEYEADKGTRLERTIESIALTKCGFYLPTQARYDYLLNLEGDKSLAKALREAMEGIEEYQDEKFKDVLPKEAFFDIEKKKADILPQLLKTFSDIPKDASGDIFGKIYEYFLGKFAMSEGQKGGEFFTPTSVVRFIVEVIEPFAGKIYDPACGSGGMFVQSARFVQEANHDLSDIYVYGQEYMGETVRLAKMNLMVNNIRGEIAETNSYESDPYNSYGMFDYVMANPPFNVKSVKENTVNNDKRFYEYGLPKTLGKQDDNISEANYLWISLFATSLNDNGRAGFVMPNSASDAGSSEYEIRKKLIDSGIVDCMVSMPPNMFFTVTLPATIWFFDKKKVKTDRKDKILFLDARNVYNQINRAQREWTEEQQLNLAAIVRLYRGESDRFLELIDNYIKQSVLVSNNVDLLKESIEVILKGSLNALKNYTSATKDEVRTFTKKEVFRQLQQDLNDFTFTESKQYKERNNEHIVLLGVPMDNVKQHQVLKYINMLCTQNGFDLEALKKDTNTLMDLYKLAEQNAKLKSDKNWTKFELPGTNKKLEETLKAYTEAVETAKYWYDNIAWLQNQFPNAQYQDVVGLCKMADPTEYADEHDYSLNAGRYVGVVIGEDNKTEEEFKNDLECKAKLFKTLNSESEKMELNISEHLINLLL